MKYVMIKPKLNPARGQKVHMYRGSMLSEPIEYGEGKVATGFIVEDEVARRVLRQRGWVDVTEEYMAHTAAKSEAPKPKKKSKSKKD